MRRGICVKCGAATVYAAKNGVETGDRPNATYLRPHLPPDFRGVTRNQPTEVWNFACGTCGYLEWYVMEAGGIAFIQQQWMAVQASPDPGAPEAPA